MDANLTTLRGSSAINWQQWEFLKLQCLTGVVLLKEHRQRESSGRHGPGSAALGVARLVFVRGGRAERQRGVSQDGSPRYYQEQLIPNHWYGNPEQVSDVCETFRQSNFWIWRFENQASIVPDAQQVTSDKKSFLTSHCTNQSLLLSQNLGKLQAEILFCFGKVITSKDGWATW